MSLVVWLPLNGNLNNQGLDNIAFTNACGATVSSAGKIGSCYSFATMSGSGISNGAETSYFMNKYINNHSFSLCAWVKTSSSDTTVINLTYGLWLSLTNGGKVNIMLYNSSRSVACTGTTNLANGDWHHIVGTYDVSTNKICVYADGVLEATAQYTSGFTYASSWTNGLYIGRNSNDSTQSAAYFYQGLMNDVRIYDHALSAKEVKELSKGLCLHYTLADPYIESTTNYAPIPETYSTGASPGWDTSLNGSTAYTPSSWASGYNGGVTAPTTGYHAHWVFDNNKLVMLFPNKNSVIGQKGRWLGISRGILTTGSIIPPGTKYTISWDQKTDTLGGYTTSGIYYKKVTGGSYNFWDDCPLIGQNTKTGVWQHFSHTFTRVSDFDKNTESQSIYVYGHYGTESNMWVKNIQLEIKDHDTPWVNSNNSTASRNETTIADCSGFGNKGTIGGTLYTDKNSKRYSSSTQTRTSTNNFIAAGRGALVTDEITVNVWAYMSNWSSYNSSGRLASCTEGGGWNFESNDGGVCYTIYVSGVGYIMATSSTTWTSLSSGWHMFTGVYDGLSDKLYVDGILHATTSNGKSSKTPIGYNASNGLFLFAEAEGSTTTPSSSNFVGNMSDFRIYATALSASDIADLYKNSASIDKSGALHCYQILEE